MSENKNSIHHEFFINRKKLSSRTLFTLLMFIVAAIFILKPELFLLNVFTKPYHIVTLGIFSGTYFALLLYSLIHLLSRKSAILITDDYMIDNSRFESIGKIYWSEISGIKRINNRCIEISLKDLSSRFKKISVLKKFLLFMHNWNYKRSIVVSNLWLDCSIEDLENSIGVALKNHSKH
jgi:hypothetical protein